MSSYLWDTTLAGASRCSSTPHWAEVFWPARPPDGVFRLANHFEVVFEIKHLAKSLAHHHVVICQ